MRALAALLALTPAPVLADATELAAWWTGRYDNMAQLAGGRPNVPELTTTARQMTVERVSAPQLGAVVVLLHEYKAPDIAVANRARVYVIKDLPDGRVRAVQHFFRDGPTYDRKPTDSATVALMKPVDFNFYPGCDLFFTFDKATGRYVGGMPARTCVYEHPVDGFVYAEFDQFIWPTETWYRDRSIKVATGTVRGSVDGFAYLRFGKVK